MFSTLFKTEPFLDSSTKKWVVDSFIWAFDQFSFDVFTDESSLVLPTNNFYPGSVASVHQMAQAIFDNTLKYAGMAHWPIVLVKPENFQQQPLDQLLPQVVFEKESRGDKATLLASTQLTSTEVVNIEVSYNPSQINQPQDLIASFAQSFAAILISHNKQLPPGGKDFYPQSIDLLAIFMGFGVMFANTAYQFKGGCGSCYNANANRSANLAEPESLYCLAIFSALKKLPIKQVLPHLKTHLRKDFKKAFKEIKQDLTDSTSPLILAVNTKLQS